MQPILLDSDNLRNLFMKSYSTKPTYTRQERIILSYTYSHLCQILSSQGFLVIATIITNHFEIFSCEQRYEPAVIQMELTRVQSLQKGIEADKAGKVQEFDQYCTAILKLI